MCRRGGRLRRAVCLHRLDPAAAVGLQLDEVVLLAQLECVLSVVEGYHLVVIALALVGGDVGRLVYGQRGLHGGVPVRLDVEGGGFSDVALIGAVDRHGGTVHLEGIEGIVRFVEFQRQLRAGLHREAGLQEVADCRSVDRHSRQDTLCRGVVELEGYRTVCIGITGCDDDGAALPGHDEVLTVRGHYVLSVDRHLIYRGFPVVPVADDKGLLRAGNPFHGIVAVRQVDGGLRLVAHHLHLCGMVDRHRTRTCAGGLQVAALDGEHRIPV